MKGIEKKLATENPHHRCAQIDGWSCYRHGYSGLLLNYITHSWKRVSVCIECSEFTERHTAANLANWLDEKLLKWNVADETSVMVSDTASKMLAMMDHLPNFMKRIDCLCHVINLVIKDEIVQKPQIANILSNVRSFCITCAKSLLLNSMLKDKMRESY